MLANLRLRARAREGPKKGGFQKEVLESPPGVVNDVEVFLALREDPRYFIVHCASTGAFAIVGQN